MSSPKLGGVSAPPSFPTTDKFGDRETRRQREFFSRVRRGEAAYSVNLRKIAQHVGDLVKAFDPTSPAQLRELENALRRYADLLTPWARATASRMLVDVSRRDEKVWAEYTKFLGVNLRREITSTPIGDVMRSLLSEQVSLITSLPTEAAERVHRLASESLYTGSRANALGGLIEPSVSAEILRTGETTRSRANLIARTEVGRAATTLTQARAESVGSVGYIWTTAHDYDVRPLHKKLDGTFVRWDDPPVSGEKGERAHAGCIYNCRCFSYPILPGEATVSKQSWHSGR